MTSPTPYNGRVPLERFLDARFAAVEDHMDTRFDALIEAFHEHCADASDEHKDHEKRLRALEKQSPFRNAAEAVTGAIALVAMALGLIDG